MSIKLNLYRFYIQNIVVLKIQTKVVVLPLTPPLGGWGAEICQ